MRDERGAPDSAIMAPMAADQPAPSTPGPLDPLDDRMVALLRANPRTTNRDVAKALGVSEPTVADRLRKLEDAGRIRFTVQWSTRALGLDFFCLLLVEAEFGRQQTVAEQLTAIDEINNVTSIMGGQLLAADLAVTDAERFVELLTSRVGRIDGIRSIRHYPFLKIVKLRNEVTPWRDQGPWRPRLETCRPRFDYDALDLAIFDRLSHDARSSQRELGRVLGENPARIRYRFKRYEEQRMFRHTLLLDRTSVGYQSGYFVRLLVRAEDIQPLTAYLATLDWVPFVGLVSGDFNVLFLAMGESFEHLDQRLGHIQTGTRDFGRVVVSDVLPLLGAYKTRADLVFMPSAR